MKTEKKNEMPRDARVQWHPQTSSRPIILITGNIDFNHASTLFYEHETLIWLPLAKN